MQYGINVLGNANWFWPKTKRAVINRWLIFPCLIWWSTSYEWKAKKKRFSFFFLFESNYFSSLTDIASYSFDDNNESIHRMCPSREREINKLNLNNLFKFVSHTHTHTHLGHIFIFHLDFIVFFSLSLSTISFRSK